MSILNNMIKKIIKRLIYKEKCDVRTYLDYLRKRGAEIGSDVNLFNLQRICIDSPNAHLLHIGDHVNIVSSTILAHDYSWSVLKTMTGEILGNQKSVHIGNNVFIGEGSIILCGTTIGDNVIIGARSVVSGYVSSNSVWGGVPAKRIMSIEEYYQKRKSVQFDEAKNVVLEYKRAHGTFPPMEVMHEYFFLFSDEKDCTTWKKQLELCQNSGDSLNYIGENKPMFSSYEEFLAACLKSI